MNNNVKPTISMLEKSMSIMSKYSSRKPMMAVGMLPTIMNKASFPSSLPKSRWRNALRMFIMSFLKVTNTTSIVPMCMATSKKTSAASSVRRMYLCAMAKCPELDIGSHSVVPWIMAKINVWIISMVEPVAKSIEGMLRLFFHPFCYVT